MSRKRAHQVFEEALQQVPALRGAFVESRCGGDAGLLDEVLSLLAALERAGEFLGHPTGGEAARNGATAADKSTLDVPLPEGPGAVIGRYKLLQQIGEGGFGVVFLAEQREPVVRRVALKIIKLGMDTRQVVARFEQERQALAIMDHPNIAKVLDAGATESGRPYFVMELVRGDPITEYCDRNGLDTRERLDLFRQICNAVQHAHTKGIIHRDLKPSNVLITVADGRPIPKVIDFGIAKATSARLTAKTLFTEHKALIGTPAYMSPEQAEMSGVDIDTRSDIYSLGVLLYELLTGTTPFDTKTLLAAGLAEIQRVIREVEPEKPSTRLSTMKATLSKVAAQRHTEPARLSALVRGDLDWIVMKALEKDRTRRYETAHALAMEVEHYLRDEPVLAGPPSRVYRFRKFVRRNRGMVTAAALVIAALLLGMAGTTFGLLRAEERRAEAEAAQGREREQRELAEQREKETQQVTEFQMEMLRGINVVAMGRGIKERLRKEVKAGLERKTVGEFPDRRPQTPAEIEAELASFDRLTYAAQAVDVARGVMDEFVLARAAEALEKEFADQPLVQAQLRLSIGQTYQKLGLSGAAEPLLRAALEIQEKELGCEHPVVEGCLNQLAQLLADQGDYSGAEALQLRALEKARQTDGEEAEHTAVHLNNLALVLAQKGDLPAAVELVRKALDAHKASGDEHLNVVASLKNSLGMLLSKQREYAEAEPLLRDALRTKRELLGDQDPEVAACMSNLAFLLTERGDLAEAEKLYTEALEIVLESFGHEYHLTATALSNLGVLFEKRGDYARSASLRSEALEIRRNVLDYGHPDVESNLINLAKVLRYQRKYREAETLLEEALAMQRQRLEDTHPVMWSLWYLGECLRLRGEYTAATARFREALAILREGIPDPEYLHHIAHNLRAMREFGEAEEAARQAVEIYRANADSSHEQRHEHRHAVDVLTQTLIDSGKPDEAILVRQEFVEDCRRLLPAKDLSLAEALLFLGHLLVKQGKDAEAEPWLREAVAIREDALGPDSPDYWFVATARSQFGGALAGQGAALTDSDAPAAIAKFAEAELQLVDSGRWLTQNAERIPQQYRHARLREATERIVRLYESWDTLAPDSGKAQLAAAWRTDLERLSRSDQ